MAKWSLRLYDIWYEHALEKTLALLEPNPTARLIDLGCGDGGLTVKAKRRIGCNEVWGLDIYEPFIKRARRKGIKVVKWDLNTYPYPFENHSFDVIISNQVIEHLFYPIRFLGEVWRILEPGGYTVISTENLASWDNVLALLLGFTPFSIHFDYPFPKLGNPLSPHNGKKGNGGLPPHLRIFTLRSLQQALNLLGFKITKVVGAGHVLGKVGEVFEKNRCRFMIVKALKP